MDRGVRFYVNCSHRLRFFLHYRKHSTHTGDDKRLLRPVLRFLRAVGDRGLMASSGSRRDRLCTQWILGQLLCMVF